VTETRDVRAERLTLFAMCFGLFVAREHAISAFMAGLHAAMWTGTGLCVLAAAVAAAGLRGRTAPRLTQRSGAVGVTQ
jgi:multisubunit Na+/H+ antiporter MnhB subunit